MSSNFQPTLQLSRDGRLALAMFMLACFGVGLPRLFTFTAAYTNFVDTWGAAAAVPWTYLGAAVTVPLAGLAYYRFERRVSFAKLVLGILIVDLVGLGMLWAGLRFSDHPWIALAAAIWVELEWSALYLVFWGLAARIYGPRDSKRWLGIAAAGEPFAMLLGGLAVPILLRVVGVTDLLLVSAGAQVVALLLAARILRQQGYRLEQGSDSDAEEGAGERGTVQSRAAIRRYVWLLVALAILFELVYFFLDFAFYNLADARYPEPVALAEFFGVFQAGVAVFTLIANVFVCRWLMERHGAGAGLLVLPAVLLCGAVGVLTGSVVGAVFLVFWLVIGSKFALESFDGGLYRPALTVLYQVLPPRLRTRRLALADTIFAPVATGVAGASLLALVHYQLAEPAWIFSVAGGLMVLWLGLAWVARGEYRHMLHRALARGQWRGPAEAISDGISTDVIRRGMHSRHPAERVLAMQLLLDSDRDDRLERIRPLLADADVAVRRQCARALETHVLVGVFDVLGERLAVETDGEVRGGLLRAAAAADRERARPLLAEGMEDRDLVARQHAIVALLRHGGIEGVLAAGERVLQLVRSEWLPDRLLAARVLGEVRVAQYYEPVLELLQDHHPEVRRAAIRVAASLQAPALFPALIENLTVPTLRESAAAALVACGQGALESLLEALEALPVDDELRVELVAIAARLDPARAASLLAQQPAPAAPLREESAVAALHASGQTIPESCRESFADRLDAAAACAFRIRNLSDRLAGDPRTSALRAGLEQLFGRYQAHMYALLALVHDSAALSRPWHEAVQDAEGDIAQYTLEVLEYTVNPGWRATVLPLLDPAGSSGQGSTARAAPPPFAGVSLPEALDRLGRGREAWATPWVRACALYTAGQHELEEVRSAAMAATEDPDGMVRETALWVLHKLATPRIRRIAGGLLADSDDRVAGLAQEIIMVTR